MECPREFIVRLNVLTMVETLNPTSGHAPEVLFARTRGFRYAGQNNAHARTEMIGEYNNYHHVQSFVVGQYVTTIFHAWTVLPRIVNGSSVAL